MCTCVRKCAVVVVTSLKSRLSLCPRGKKARRKRNKARGINAGWERYVDGRRGDEERHDEEEEGGQEAEDGEQLCPFVHSVVGWPKLTPASLEPRLSWAGRVALSLAAGFPYRAARGVAARFPTPPQGAEAALGRFGTAASHASLRPVRGQAQRRIAPASPLL